MSEIYSPLVVAQYMTDKLESNGELYQEDIVYEIEKKFGGDCVYDNERGNLAIDKKVLKEFKKLTPDAVWDRRERMWQKRESGDTSTSRILE